MARKLLTFLAAVLLPGGFLALFGLWAVELAARTERGQRVLVFARSHAPAALLALPGRLPTVRW